MFNKVCLLIITACSVAFIWFEYQPKVTTFNPSTLRVHTATPEQRIARDWRCYSNKFTERFKREIGDCY